MPGSTSSLAHGASLAGRTVIITGGNTGLGFEVARQTLLLKASRLIITTRSQAKGESAIAALRGNSEIQRDNPDCQIEFFDLDLDDYQSGLRFCQRVREQVPEVDLLLCNAGIQSLQYEISKSGHERVMQVNAYTHFLIVFELLNLLRATAAKRGSPARVTFLGSYNHVNNALDQTPIPPDCTVLDYFDSKTLVRADRRYNSAKFAIIAFVQNLATLVPSSEVVVNSVCPGVVHTGIVSRLPMWMQAPTWVYMKLVSVSVEEGGKRIVHAAVKVGDESHGKFLPMGGQVSGATPLLDTDPGKAFKDQLWAEVLADVKLVDPALAAL